MGKTFRYSDKYNNSHKKNRPKKRVNFWERDMDDKQEKRNKFYSPFEDAPDYHENFA